MEQGNFVFISDAFFEKYAPHRELMENKETGNKRPCYFAFSDRFNPNVLWCVPISSRIEKYESIVANKIQRQIEHGQKHPKCNTIRFGTVLGQKRAFLIQNMFPTIREYVDSVYIDRNTQNPVSIDPETKQDIDFNANTILRLVRSGYTNLVFSNILKIYKELLIELEQRDKLSEDQQESKAQFQTEPAVISETAKEMITQAAAAQEPEDELEI